LLDSKPISLEELQATDTSKLISLEELQATDNFEKVTVLVKDISTNPPDTVNDIPHQDVFLY